jgi:hypothetical protein
MLMGAERQVRRNGQKIRYAKFGKAWRAEQRYQKGVLVAGGTLPEGTPVLGRKPTFKQWLEATEKHRLRQETMKPIEVQEFVGADVLDWEDDVITTPEGQPVEGQTEVQGQ